MFQHNGNNIRLIGDEARPILHLCWCEIGKNVLRVSSGEIQNGLTWQYVDVIVFPAITASIFLLFLFPVALYWSLPSRMISLKLLFIFLLLRLQPQTICTLESLSRLVINREDDITHTVSICMQPDRIVSFMMEDRDALEFTLVLVGYHRLLSGLYAASLKCITTRI